MQFRRSDYDVTNTVQVSSVASVRKAVEELFLQTWPGANTERLTTAFADFERLFSGQFPGYLGCDTVYHDMQHSLDDTLAMARLLAGYDRTHAPEQRLGAERALLGIIVGLFHDSGYIGQSVTSVPVRIIPSQPRPMIAVCATMSRPVSSSSSSRARIAP